MKDSLVNMKRVTNLFKKNKTDDDKYMLEYRKYNMNYSELLKRSIKMPDFTIWIKGPSNVGKNLTIKGVSKSLQLKVTPNMEYKYYRHFKSYILSDFIKIPECIMLNTEKKFFSPCIYIFKSRFSLNEAISNEIIHSDISSDVIAAQCENIKNSSMFYEVSYSIEGDKKPSLIDNIRNSKYIVNLIVLSYVRFLITQGYENYVNMLHVRT
ncbi:adenylate kinase [Finch poxvirus]|uniref:Adenylate kinase n=2 Tax=unclassified Avipoxvirus TaxID=336487 RepID=A0AAT9UQT0_9POXV|nr:adenylate kinase [Finch poxvirus]UOX38894.1 adenylate kinase [Finch poxvirus]